MKRSLSLQTPMVSPNYNDRPKGRAVDMIVIHYTGMESASVALRQLCDTAKQVSAHYLIDEDGTVHRLVDEDKRAWHAGVAWWRGAVDVNARSIGIELVNPGHEFGYRPFPAAQMTALEALCKAISKRHAIPKRNVVAHSDVAPGRKMDPGELFDWPRLARAGIGLWPLVSPPADASDAEVEILLSAYGYDVCDLKAAVTAFQRHYRQGRVNGVADGETVGILKALLQMAEA